MEIKPYMWIVGIVAQVISLIFMILALSVPKWVSHGSGDSSIELGAYRCTDCPDANQNWSWECFAKYYCFADEDSEACSTYDDGLKGSSGFVLAEIVAILFQSLTLLRLTAYKLEKDYGNKYLAYAYSLIPPIAHSIGVAIWFTYTKADFSDDCDAQEDPDDSIQFCAEYGVILVIIEIFLSLFATLAFILLFWNRNSQRDLLYIKIEGSLLGLHLTTFMIVTVIFSIIGIMFQLLSLSTSQWFETDSNTQNWTGGLLRCDDCSEIDNFGFDCLSAQICDLNSDLGICQLYEDVNYGSQVVIFIQYVAFCIGSIIFLIIFADSLNALVNQRDFGVWQLNYILPIAAVLSQITGTIVWLVMAQPGDCEEDQKDEEDRPEICLQRGPGFAIAASLVLLLMAIAFFLGYKQRKPMTFTGGEIEVITSQS